MVLAVFKNSPGKTLLFGSIILGTKYFQNFLTFLDPALSLCSHSQTPCQVPRLSFPSDTGTVRLEPRKHAFTWAGCSREKYFNKSKMGKYFITMSSGPSQECLNGRSSGTILLSIISMSSLTSGSQFSLMASEADVWSNCMCISPTENWESSGS